MKKYLLKNKLAAAATLLLALFALPATMQAQDLSFGSVKVTRANCNNLVDAFKTYYKNIGIFGGLFCNASGTVKYDFATHTLTLNNANITLTTNPGTVNGIVFSSDMDMLKVNLVGYNVIDSGTAAFHQSRKVHSGKDPELIFTGTGTLKITNKGTLSSKYAGINLYADGKMSVQCKELSVTSINGLGIGANFNYASSGRLMLSVGNSSVLIAKGKAGSIAKVNNFSMGSGLKFHKPAGARFNSSKHAVCDAAGNVITAEVGCAPYGWVPTGIEAVKVDVSQDKRGIYTLEGLRLNGELKDLPQGIYIVDGRKVVK